jgi:transcriptional regulator
MEENELKPLKVDRTKLITQSKYAQENGTSKQNVYALIKAGKLEVVKIKGATLVLLP